MTIRILLVSVLITLSSINANVVNITSKEIFDRHYMSDKPMVTMYTSKGCMPCKRMKPLFYAAAEAITDITFAILEVKSRSTFGFHPEPTELEVLTKAIRSVPTLIFSHKGKEVKREHGLMNREQLNTSINTFRSTT